MTWKHYIKKFTEYLLIERGLSENTRINYQNDCEHLSFFYKDTNLNPVDIKVSDLQHFIYEYSKTHKTRSQARLLSGLNAFFEYLVLEDYRKDNPMLLIEAPKIGLHLPDTLSEEEINLLIDGIDLSHPQGERNRTILETLYGCGLRVSELIELKISDLYFNEGFIKVTGKGNKQRLVPIGLYTQNFIENYLQNHRELTPPKKGNEDIIFLNRRGNALTRVMIYTIIKQLAEKINLKKNISPHTFRHSFASHLLQGGADLTVIKTLLGHESITTTEVYLHMDSSRLAEVVNQYHPRAQK
ncbi:site-specific tyrosine recombinase [Ochrovirga pacifica]|uniref:site-specific tyrosine recombinase n=1 Tax=Ochrovirga pacifica TaxID=1042376 RepID=UPI0002559AD6|nr:site-specific tyrosine recombinase [Ochrovirga pacifica]